MKRASDQLDLSLLPPSSRREIRDFYHFLLTRHGKSKRSDRGTKPVFTDLCGVLSWQGDALAVQRSLRDEW